MATSRTGSPNGVVLIDHNRAARRVAVLKEALAEVTQAKPDQVPGSAELKDLYTYRKADIEAAVAPFPRCAAFIVVDEERLSKLTDDQRVPRVPCDSIACGYEVMCEHPTKLDLYFVVRRNATGLDIISMLLSGARGVIDSEVLGSRELIGEILSRLRNSNTQTRILAGRASRVFDSFIQLIRSKHRMAKRHFSLLVALSEIPRFRLDISDKVTQKEVVSQVQSHFDETGYEVKLDTYKLLPTLLTIMKGEMSEDYMDDVSNWDEESFNEDSRVMLSRSEKQELAFLPLYARNFGLPPQVLPVRGVNQKDLIKHLYTRGVYGIETLNVRRVEKVEIREVTLPPERRNRHKRRIRSAR